VAYRALAVGLSPLEGPLAKAGLLFFWAFLGSHDEPARRGGRFRRGSLLSAVDLSCRPNLISLDIFAFRSLDARTPIL
jgi:hypothetical protein